MKNITSKKEFFNTYTNSRVRYIVFKKGSKWYSVALEFNIVEVDNNPKKVLDALFMAVEGYIISARENKLDLSVLNQKPNKEYEKLWESIMINNRKTSIKRDNQKIMLPRNIYSYGFKNLIAV